MLSGVHPISLRSRCTLPSRARLVGVSITLAILPMATCCKPIVGLPATPPPPTAATKTATDVWPAWAPSGDWIVFHRRFPTTYGPPGIYKLSLTTGGPQLVCAGSYIGPTAPRISPDEKTLVAEWAGQIVLIDIATGAVRQPMYTDNFASMPDWSPDGRRIVYARLQRRYNEPPDSAGTHILDLTTARDAYTGTEGLQPRWSPDGIRISQTVGLAPAFLICFNTSAGTLDTVFIAPDQLDNPQWTRPFPDNRMSIALTAHSGRNRQSFLADPESHASRILQPTMNLYDAVSPDGRSLIFLRAQHDSTAVLFFRRLDDPFGTSIRQLTHYEQQ